MTALGALPAVPGIFGPFDLDHVMREIWRFQVSQAGLSVLQGITSETSTQLTVDLPIGVNVEFSLTAIRHRHRHFPAWVRTATRPPSEMRTDKILFTGLEPGLRYRLEVKDTDRNTVLDERYLSTVDLNKRDARIAVMSCMNDIRMNIGPIWETAHRADADYYFFIGDAIYGDPLIAHGPDLLWRRFVDGRNTIPFYKWKNLKPVLALWDDHDFGKNNADASYPHKEANLRTFESFFAQEALDGVLQAGPGISRYFRGFHQNFLFLDNRYFRGLNGGFLGQAQLDWAAKVMATATGPTWIMEGSPFYGRADKGEGSTYEISSPAEFTRLHHEIKKWNAPAVFLGGDVHYTEVSRVARGPLDYATYEFISSCMHSTTKSAYYQNTNTHLNGTFERNFLLFEKQGLAQDPSWRVSCLGEGQAPLFRDIYSV